MIEVLGQKSTAVVVSLQTNDGSAPRVVFVLGIALLASNVVVKQPAEERVGGEQLSDDNISQFVSFCGKLAFGDQLRAVPVVAARCGYRSCSAHTSCSEHCQPFLLCAAE